jgi:hypothetical protein
MGVMIHPPLPPAPVTPWMPRSLTSRHLTDGSDINLSVMPERNPRLVVWRSLRVLDLVPDDGNGAPSSSPPSPPDDADGKHGRRVESRTRPRTVSSDSSVVVDGVLEEFLVGGGRRFINPPQVPSTQVAVSSSPPSK